MSNFYISKDKKFIVNLDLLAEIVRSEDTRYDSAPYKIVYAGVLQEDQFYSKSLIDPLIDFIENAVEKEQKERVENGTIRASL